MINQYLGRFQEKKKMTVICMYCKGKLHKGLQEFIARVLDQIVIIKDPPALICKQCGEAYYDEKAMMQIDKVRESINDGTFVAHPIAAGEISISEL